MSAMRVCTCWSAVIMSVPSPNCAEISAEPRNVRDRIRRIPGTSITACSIGRVTPRAMDCGGVVPLCAMTTTRGNRKAG